MSLSKKSRTLRCCGPTVLVLSVYDGSHRYLSLLVSWCGDFFYQACYYLYKYHRAAGQTFDSSLMIFNYKDEERHKPIRVPAKLAKQFVCQTSLNHRATSQSGEIRENTHLWIVIYGSCCGPDFIPLCISRIWCIGMNTIPITNVNFFYYSSTWGRMASAYSWQADHIRWISIYPLPTEKILKYWQTMKISNSALRKSSM